MSSLIGKFSQQQFFCAKCSRYFSDKKELDIHLRDHLAERHPTAFMKLAEPYACKNCHKTFEIKSDLMIHYNTVCYDEPYTCKHCRLSCQNVVHLQLHLKYKHDYTDNMLREATRLETKPLHFVPTSEDEVTEKDSLRFISEALEQGSSKKKVFPFTSSSSYNKPSKSKSKSQSVVPNQRRKDYVCDICDECFSRKCVLDVHILNHADDEKLVFLAQHTAIREKDSASETEDASPIEVDEIFSSENLKPSTVVLGSSVWKQCNVKDQSSVMDAPKLQKRKRKRAKKATTALRKKKAQMQSKKRSLKVRFSCEICKKMFKDNYKLQRHFVIHTGSRPYVCTKCNKDFTRVDHLKRHSFICPTIAEEKVILVSRTRKRRSLK